MAVALAGMSLHTNNDNEGGWAGTDGPDAYNNSVQGTNSESWQVSKNATETGTLTKSSALNATRGLFSFWMSSNLAPYYTDIQLDLQSTAGNDKNYTIADSTDKEISGVFVPIVIDYNNKGTETGTFAPAGFSLLNIVIDNSTSGNIRSVINNWVDVMYFGPGHTISGTTTGDALFAEAAAVDELVANQYGIMWNYNDIIFCQGDLDLSGTALTSIGETLVFVDTPNGYDTYNLEITGTVEWINTNIQSSGAIDYNLDATAATAFSMTGGTITGALLVDLIDGQTLNGVVLTDVDASTIANDPAVCTWNLSGLVTVAAAGSLIGCTLNKGTGASAVDIANLDRLLKNDFYSDGTGHAVDLGTIASNISMAWDNSELGYAVADGSTGNETILVSVNTGITLTINVAATGSTPTIKNDGLGTVLVVAGQKTFSFTVNPSITGYEWRLYEDSGVPGELGTVELDGEETATQDNQSYSYSYSTDQDIVLQILDADYVENIQYFTLVNGDQDVTINLILEENT
jgi:hypothetical protein